MLFVLLVSEYQNSPSLPAHGSTFEEATIQSTTAEYMNSFLVCLVAMSKDGN